MQKCPECGEILLIPPAGIPFAEPTPPSPSPSSPFAGSGGFPPPPSGPAGGSPFGAGGQPQYQPETGNPYQSPSEFATMPSMPAAAGEIRPTAFDIGDVLGRTWTIFKEQWAMCLGAVVIVGVCNWVFSMVTQRLFSVFYQPVVINAPNVRPQDAINIMLQELPKSMALGTLTGFVNMLFTAWTSAGLAVVLLKVAKGQPANIADVFSGGKYYVPMLATTFIYTLATQIGFLLLIVPGIIIALMLGQYYYLIVDRNLGIMESLEMSKVITSGNKLMLFLNWFVCAGIIIAGALCCLVGLVAAMPYVALLNTVIYLTMTGQPTADQVRAGMGIR